MDYIQTKKLVDLIIDKIYKDLVEGLYVTEGQINPLYEKWKNLSNEYFNKEICVGFFDGSAKPNPGNLKLGGYIKNSKGNVIHEFSSRDGKGTNNEAEYKAFIRLLEHAIRLGIKNIRVYGDSMLVVNQINKIWKCNHNYMKPLFAEAIQLVSYFDSFQLIHILRNKNRKADKLTK